MDLESPPRIGARAPSHSHAHHGICSCKGALRLRLSSSQHPSRRLHRRFSMDLRNGHVLLLREAFQVQLFPHKRMERYVAPPIIPSIHKNADQNAMARCGWCMPHGSVIVVHARCASSVKNRQPPSKLGGSVRCIGLSLPVQRSQRRPHLQQVNLFLHWVLIQCVFRDWQRRFHRRELVKLLAHQRVEVRVADASPPPQPSPDRPFSRAQRAHYRLSWTLRLARNAARPTSSSLSITLFGIPEAFADAIGLATRLQHSSSSCLAGSFLGSVLLS